MERFAECIDCCDRLLALQSEEKDRKVTNVVREKALERKEKKERKEGEAKERERRKTDGEKALRRAYAVSLRTKEKSSSWWEKKSSLLIEPCPLTVPRACRPDDQLPSRQPKSSSV
jgi:hypothetical protein